MLIFNRRHLDVVLREFIEHYNDHRPHRSLGQLPPRRQGAALVMGQNVDRSRLRRTDRLGGLIHEHRLVA
jgi:putative transposase